jgi:hypothetical protein
LCRVVRFHNLPKVFVSFFEIKVEVAMTNVLIVFSGHSERGYVMAHRLKTHYIRAGVTLRGLNSDAVAASPNGFAGFEAVAQSDVVVALLEGDGKAGCVEVADALAQEKQALMVVFPNTPTSPALARVRTVFLDTLGEGANLQKVMDAVDDLLAQRELFIATKNELFSTLGRGATPLRELKEKIHDTLRERFGATEQLALSEADFVVDDFQGQCAVVAVQKATPSVLIGLTTVQELTRAKFYAKAARAILIAPPYLTQAAARYAAASGIEIVHPNDLDAFLARPKSAVQPTSDAKPTLG